jgi:hypothetical protein
MSDEPAVARPLRRLNCQEDILKMIDGLEELADGRFNVMGKSFCMDLEEFHMLTNKIKASLPDEMRKATRVANDSDRIVASAREEAEAIKAQTKAECERVLAEARQSAARLIESSEVNKLAKAQAQEILNSAEYTARDVKRGADEYAREVLAAIENHLAKVMSTLQKGREKLEDRINTTLPAEPMIPAGRGVKR